MSMPTSDGTASELVLDLDRAARCGFPEVVYGPGKSIETILEVFARQQAAGQQSLVTRASEDQLAAIAEQFPLAQINVRARSARLGDAEQTRGHVVVATAGTSDRPVAEEACETLRWMGVSVDLVMDVGVAGPQRFLARREQFRAADVVIVVAGMEGALPSVVGGWVDTPVIGVPTSVGYGASLGGFSALLSMLNSCASNVTVVNIDAGFKAGYVAGLIARRQQDTTTE
ncbi:MAG: nickel pincer cofactor biosynthesis protein LarB [Planctomycetaceae bacterium]|nr:nickel pincer cofactor biosynthesis protein LarB [Planctomycetaceae bacterium]